MHHVPVVRCQPLENPVSFHELNATPRHLLGLNHRRLTNKFRDYHRVPDSRDEAKHMSKDVLKRLEIVRRYLLKPTPTGRARAEDAVSEISELSDKKRTRAAAKEALLEIVRSADRELAGDAMFGLASLLEPDDDALIPFLRERMSAYNDDDVFYLQGLLAILGPAAFPDAVQLLKDSQRSMGSRCTVLEDLEALTDIPFARDIEGESIYDVREEQLHLDEVAAWEADGFAERTPEPFEANRKTLAEKGFLLPDDYAAFLETHSSRQQYEFDDQNWSLLTSRELREFVDIDEATYLAVGQLEGYADTMRQAMGEDATFDAKGKPYPFTRLASGIAIGTNESGDVLYLDPEDGYSVWIFSHDGGDVERVAKTFTTWKKKSRKA